MTRQEFATAYAHARKVSYAKFVAAGEMSPAEALLGLKDAKRDAASAWRSLHPDDRAKPVAAFFATSLAQPDPLGTPFDWQAAPPPHALLTSRSELVAVAGYLAGLRAQALELLHRLELTPLSDPVLTVDALELLQKLARDPNDP